MVITLRREEIHFRFSVGTHPVGVLIPVMDMVGEGTGKRFTTKVLLKE